MSQQKAILGQDLLLTDVSSGYFPEEFISEQILPVVQHAQTSGKLGMYGTSHLRIVTSSKGGKGKYRQVDTQSYNSALFLIEGHGLSDIVTKEDYKNVLQPFKAEEDMTKALTTLLWLEKEKGLADILGDTAILTQNTTLTGSNQFNDYSNSDPVAAFQAARAAVMNGCGVEPNIAVMSWEVKEMLRYHPQLLDALGFKWAAPGGLKDQDLANVLQVEKILVGKARYESAKEGQTSSLAPVWAKNIIFAVAPQKPAPQQVSLGYTVRHAGEAARQVYKESLMDPPGSTKILVDDSYDQLISNAKAAYLIKNAIA